MLKNPGIKSLSFQVVITTWGIIHVQLPSREFLFMIACEGSVSRWYIFSTQKMKKLEEIQITSPFWKHKKSCDESALTFKQIALLWARTVCSGFFLSSFHFPLMRRAKKPERETRKGNEEMQFKKWEAFHVMDTFTAIPLERHFKWRPPTATICRIAPNWSDETYLTYKRVPFPEGVSRT